MSQRPTLKLKLSTAGQGSTAGSEATPSSATPTPKIRFILGPSTPRTNEPASLPPNAEKVPLKATKKVKKAPPPRLSKPKKRNITTATVDDVLGNPLHPDSGPTTATKRIKLSKPRQTPITPGTTTYIKTKLKGRPPIRPLGVGYDSEASDREEDPAIEEEFILRMQPGDDCEYLRRAIENKRWGPPSQGGANVRLKFLERDGRRALLAIRGTLYAAVLVDLPCIVEAMKSWDKRGWWKTADICQMLMVLGTVTTEQEAREYPLPGKELNKDTWQYAHGLTPPMRWVRRRRFRKRLSNRTIERMEEEVDRLIRLDEECGWNSRYERIDSDRFSKGPSGRDGSESEAGITNAGLQSELEEQDTYRNANDASFLEDAELDDDGLEADLEQAMMASDAEEIQPTPLPVTTEVNTTSEIHLQTDSEVATPGADTPFKEDSGDDDSGSDEDDVEEEIDEDVLEQQADLRRQREEIADLEAVIESQSAELATMQNQILRKKKIQKIQSLKGDLELKRAAIGEGGDD